ncbi:tryptophan halogenase [Oleiagrimonas soli]|uniref:Tryptophan halogenase n=1 Tax=Oleiagrimonas soli TaxID=1543381 RepID=A0A099CZ85_9GAMM|nr:tryptophan halogenase [Oleiagrimonas soli]
MVVAGGGTAGWMTALLLAHSAYGPRLQITLLESPQVGAIGVGEGSTPWLRGFFDELDIEEAEWMPACNATYKSGITFEGWSTRPGFESYFHSFASMLDNLTMPQFVDNVHARLNRADVHAHPDRFFISTKLARDCLAPKPQRSFPFDVWYGYHFDSVLLGRFLHDKGVQRGVRHRVGHVTAVQQHDNGDIALLRLDDDTTLAADFFVDCTGFASLLIGKTLQTPFVSYAENLFNDAAVALPVPHDGPIMSQTVSTALRNGWSWKIPLTHRHGHGYVYSSAFCSAEDAETELRAHLGLLDADVPVRHLKMRVGRMQKHWHRNCVANGLAQGFIEPLEATALLFVQRTATLLVRALEKGDLGERAQTDFNTTVNDLFEGTRDYIVAHYKTNTRTDTDYWRENAANTRLSPSLERLLRTWLASEPIIPGLNGGAFGKGYPIMSWYSLLAGMGLFPNAGQMRPATKEEARHDLAQIDNLIERSATNFPDHRELLQNIPLRSRENSLQAYFW